MNFRYTEKNTVRRAEYLSNKWLSDANETLRLVQAGSKLPPELWAVWVAERTGIYTHLFCLKFHPERKIVGEASHADGPLRGRLIYLRPDEIADRRNIWFLTLGKGAMLKAILLLDQESDRVAALEAAGACYNPETRQAQDKPSLPEVIHQLAEQLKMDDLPEPKPRPEKHGVTPGPIMTEPRELFEQELQIQQERRGRKVSTEQASAELQRFLPENAEAGNA